MLDKLLITGANGQLGAVCRAGLAPLARTLRLSARKGLGEAGPLEEIIYCDLEDNDAVRDLVDGCDGIVHMGGQSVEADWDTIRRANIDGMFNLYEAARLSSVPPRIVFASSNHATGFYPVTETLDPDMPPRPDGLYGVSKVFGEALARMYFDKFGIETASIRIGSCFPEPQNHRALSTWLSHADLLALISRIFATPVLGCPVIYGVSNNSARWWSNQGTVYLGWTPQDSADPYRDKIASEHPKPDPTDDAVRFQGGGFCTTGILPTDN